jgi:hypothetical protein
MVTCTFIFRRRIGFKQYIFGICTNFIIHLFWMYLHLSTRRRSPSLSKHDASWPRRTCAKSPRWLLRPQRSPVSAMFDFVDPSRFLMSIWRARPGCWRSQRPTGSCLPVKRLRRETSTAPRCPRPASAAVGGVAATNDPLGQIGLRRESGRAISRESAVGHLLVGFPLSTCRPTPALDQSASNRHLANA